MNFRSACSVCAGVLWAIAAARAADEPAPLHESIVVTGTYSPLPLEEADRSIKALDVAEMPLLSNSIADFLRLDPSLDLRERAPNGVQTDLSIRGGTFGQTLVLLDGMRLNDAQSGHHNMDVPLPLEAISRIEVLHGSGSTLYGSDATGGVINFVTRRAEAPELRLRTALGNFGVNQERATLSFAHGPLSQSLTASRDFSSGFRPDRDYRNLSLASVTYFDSGLGTSRFVLAHSDRPFGADRFYGPFNSWERTKTWFASANQPLGDKTDVAFAFRRHTDLFVLYRDRPDYFTNRHAVESYQASVRRREDLATNTALYYGVEGFRDTIASSNLGDHSRNRAAAYAALDVRALRRFSFSAGLREEVYKRYRGELSPNASAGMWLSSHLKLKAAVSHAFRVPSYTDLYYHDPANVGSPNLRPESAWNYETGMDWNAGSRLRGELTVFQRRETDGIDYVLRHPGDIWRATNIQSLRFSGVEGSITAALPSSQQVDLNYTWLHGAQAALGGLQSRYAFNYPVHAAVAGWQGELHRHWLARTRLGATQRLSRSPYALWDVYLARSGGRVHPFLQSGNLTNTRYEELPGIAMPGRSIVGGLEVVLIGPR